MAGLVKFEQTVYDASTTSQSNKLMGGFLLIQQFVVKQVRAMLHTCVLGGRLVKGL